jgi:CHAD domain-containing protein
MKGFVAKRTARLVKKVGRQIANTSSQTDADSIHDLRVATRRLTECLRTFRPFFPKQAVKKVHKQLKRQMDLAAEIRSRDIAIELVKSTGASGSAKLIASMEAERAAASDRLIKLAARRKRKGSRKRWVEQLEIRQ